jgi:hypothetical protein
VQAAGSKQVPDPIPQSASKWPKAGYWLDFSIGFFILFWGQIFLLHFGAHNSSSDFLFTLYLFFLIFGIIIIPMEFVLVGWLAGPNRKGFIGGMWAGIASMILVTIIGATLEIRSKGSVDHKLDKTTTKLKLQR